MHSRKDLFFVLTHMPDVSGVLGDVAASPHASQAAPDLCKADSLLGVRFVM